MLKEKYKDWQDSEHPMAMLWEIYQEVGSLRKTSAICGLNHESTRRYLTEAGYDINSVPKAHNRADQDRTIVHGRVAIADKEILDAQPQGLSYHFYVAVREYVERHKEELEKHIKKRY